MKKVIFDFSNFAYAHYFIGQKTGVTKPKEMMQGIERQIQKIVIELQRKHAINEAVLAVDSDSFRKDIYPDYKGQRSFVFDKDELLEFASMSCLMFDKLEADDIMYLYADKYKDVIIVSEDNDMLQVVTDTTIIYKYKSKQFISGLDINAGYEGFKKVIIGCPGDNIPKCVQITEAKLDKWFVEVSDGEVKKGDVLFEYLTELYDSDKVQFELNKDLVLLRNSHKHVDYSTLIDYI